MNPFAADHKPMVPRPYQAEALDALHAHVCTKDTNPCIVLPTAAGKSPVMAWAIERWKKEYPPLRSIVLAHVKELVGQNAEKMERIWPDADIGIYAAGLDCRDMHCATTFASIDSVYSKGGEFEAMDLIIVDEAHRIPAKGEGKYRRFINDCRMVNPQLRVIGFTATPYRLSSGPICHHDHILQEIAYQANLRELIDAGYLCRLRSKAGESQPDLANVHQRGGEYIPAELAAAVDKDSVVAEAVREAVRLLEAEDRQAAIFFCVDIDHVNHVSQALRLHGWDAPAITGKTPKHQRDRIVEAFVEGRLRGICNVNVLTEGFDATRTDAVVLLRPTQSKGLYTQMVGRGLRLDPRKTDCLILDFAHCIDEHGPLDLLDAGAATIIACHKCREVFSKAVGQCPQCGWVIPKQILDAAAAAERERKMHDAKAGTRSILSGEPETIKVDGAVVERHRKPGSPDSLRVTYRCGISQFREWVCLDHDGPAAAKARRWWERRFGVPAPTVDGALEDMFLAGKVAAITDTITIRQVGKYPEIVEIALKTAEQFRS